MWPELFDINRKRRRMLEQVGMGPLHDYYDVPFPASKLQIKDVPFVVLDFETTGLDLQNDHLVSLGMVKINNLGIDLDTAWHEIIKTKREMTQQTTVIHEITDDMVGQGMEIKNAFAHLLTELKGHVLIAHHARIELGFLQKISKTLYGTDFIIPVIDTQLLASRLLQRSQDFLKEGALRLFNLRERYHLPVYKAHNALNDALATAELFLALVSDLYPNLDCKLKDLLSKK
ncbi:MAG: exonuclease domain-containing protein [Thioalkalispiraceae bacterium]|jgi:DNA polymerase-3 subunit epsilon